MGKLLLAALAVACCLALAGCVSQRGASSLPGVEIREYNGQPLSSSDDFRENSIKGPQYVNETTYRLAVDGLVEEKLNKTYDEVLALPHYSKVVELDCVEGWSVTILWEGVLVKDLLAEAKPLPGANTVIFHAYDGYTTQFPLDYFTDENQTILLAYEMNNATLRPDRGFPFQLVAESKWGYKWIKWVTEIELSNDSGYEGYWESRGYSKEGDLNKSFIR